MNSALRFHSGHFDQNWPLWVPPIFQLRNPSKKWNIFFKHYIWRASRYFSCRRKCSANQKKVGNPWLTVLSVRVDHYIYTLSQGHQKCQAVANRIDNRKQQFFACHANQIKPFYSSKEVLCDWQIIDIYSKSCKRGSRT